MVSITQKADYVRSESRKGTGAHRCHWPGCDKRVPPAMWGCKTHWFKLPQSLRTKIWLTYRPGQEISKRPSVEYIAVVRQVTEWIAEDAKE